MPNLLQKRFDELQIEMEALLASKTSRYDKILEENHDEIDGDAMLGWKVKARNLLGKACGKDSEHYKEFVEYENPGSYGTYLGALESLKSIFNAAKEDFEGGYLQSTRSLVQAEVFDSELEQATELHKSGYQSAAAVVAGVVLETTLRELCDRAGISHGKLDKINADLAKNGNYNKLIQKRITALADIRNSAAHGKPDEFTDDDVRDMIRDVERFVAEHLPS
jgi:hypothetical protein